MATHRRWLASAGIFLVACGLLALSTYGFSLIRPQPDKQKSAAEWQAMARADLDAAHAAILAAHPGTIDQLNPGFRGWTEAGYQQALKLIPRVMSYDTAMDAVRFYVTGYLDGHTLYSDNVRGDALMYVNGWRVDKVNGAYVVTAVFDKWPTALPPKGARLVECDGRSPDAIIEDDIAPVIDRRDLRAVRDGLASAIGNMHVSAAPLSRCRFQADGAALLDIDVKYEPVTSEQYWRQLVVGEHSGAHTDSYWLRDGVLWIHAGNFNPEPGSADVANLDAMLRELPRLGGVTQIVFDVRNNSGGDSAVGERIFDAATGGLDYDRSYIERLPRQYAQWRVSDVSLAAASKNLDRQIRLYGDRSEQVTRAAGHLGALTAARAAGKPWVEQDGGYRVTSADVERLHGKLRHYGGKVALLTDYNCASACLDFADLVRQVPHTVHIGQTTSADSVYIDTGDVKLPSGNHLVIPLKVWRNRLRDNNETLVPDVHLDVDMSDDAAVYAAALAALKAADDR